MLRKCKSSKMVSQSTTRWLFIRVRAVVLTVGGLFVKTPRQSSAQEVIKQPLSRCDESFCGNRTSPRPPRIESRRGGGAARGDKRRLSRRRGVMDATAGDLLEHKHHQRGARSSNARTHFIYFSFLFFSFLRNGALKMRNESHKSFNWLLMTSGKGETVIGAWGVIPRRGKSFDGGARV